MTNHEVELYLHDIVSESSLSHDLEKFLSIMILGLFLCFVSLVIMIHRITKTDRINKEILKIFSLLSLDEIHRIY